MQRLMTASRALGLGSHSSVKSTSIPTSKSRSESTDLDCNAIPFGLAFRYDSVFWIGCGGDSARPIPTQMLQHRLTSAANSAFVPSCFSPEKATQLQSIVGPTFLSSNRELVTAHQSIVTASFLADITKGDVAFQTSKWLHRQIQDDQSRLKPTNVCQLYSFDPKPHTC
jgi:hypothetical protein